MIQNLCNSMSYSEFLRQTRKAAKLTQGQLADAISARGHNVTVSAISNIERKQYKKRDGSESRPHKRFVVLAAEACGADVNEALKEADYAPKEPQTRIQKLMAALEAQGVEGMDMFGGFNQLANMTDEQYDELVKSILMLVEISVRRNNDDPRGK